MAIDNKKPTYAVVAAGVVLHKDGKYLLVQERQEKCYGKWNLPAGKVDEGDSIEYTAVKEAKEESGYEVELGEKIGVFQKTAQEAVKHVFKARIVGGKLEVPQDELLDVKWFAYDEIVKLDQQGELRDPCVVESINCMEKNGI